MTLGLLAPFGAALAPTAAEALGGVSSAESRSGQARQNGTNVINPTPIVSFGGGSAGGGSSIVDKALDNVANVTRNATAPNGLFGKLGIDQQNLNVLLIGGVIGLGFFILDRTVFRKR